MIEHFMIFFQLIHNEEWIIIYLKREKTFKKEKNGSVTNIKKNKTYKHANVSIIFIGRFYP